MTILVGVDESPHSKAVVDFIARSPWPKDARFLVISAWAPAFVTPGDAPAPGAVGQVIQIQEDYHKGLAESAAAAIRKAGVPAEGRMVPADPRAAIVDTARREEAELIVIGSHGRSGLSKLFLGSVASHVIAHAHCNVLVVKKAD